ncbi:MAG: trypsin-like peptidase domain-containing protein, partial [Thermoguttaceae bacterium]
MRRVLPAILLGVLLSSAANVWAVNAWADGDDPTPPRAVLDAEAQRIAVMDVAKDAVLAVFAANGEGGGSGVVISADGFALTNFHVVQPCGKAMKCGMADGRIYDAVIVGVDPTGDVALIKLFGRDDFPHAVIGDSDAVEVGAWCFAMGNPFLLATDFQPTVTYGIVSGVHRYQYPSGTILEYADCIQIDASINPGNSGGPLFDAQGRLIGINGRGSFEKRGRVNVGAAYAISINQIKNFLGYLHSGRVVDHATLGARVSSDDRGHVVVNEIAETSDAYRRGLRYDDEIISFGGRTISTPNGFKNALGIYPKGWRIPLSFRHDGRRYDVLVRLAGLHATEELLEKTEGRQHRMPMPLPKPGEQPKPGEGRKPEDRPEPKPIEIPIPRSHPALPRANTEPTVPEVIDNHFEARRGYANYYYNRLHRDRILAAWSAAAGLTDAGGRWRLAGELVGGGGAFLLELDDGETRLKVPAFEMTWTATDDFTSSLLPPDSGGLLPALNLWRRLAVEGADNFGEV